MKLWHLALYASATASLAIVAWAWLRDGGWMSLARWAYRWGAR